MFGTRFSGTSCKTKLKLVISRIKLVRNKRREAIKQLKREIATLLGNGQESNARIRVEHVIREENTVAAYDIIELFCELIAVRMPIIESQKECPSDLKEAISSIIWAAPRCADLPELMQAKALFAAKYGKEFVAAAVELRPECGVNRKIIKTLSVEAPTVQVKLELLKEIAKQEGVDWDSSIFEKEIGMDHQDLLDGKPRFKMPAPFTDPEPPRAMPPPSPPNTPPDVGASSSQTPSSSRMNAARPATTPTPPPPEPPAPKPIPPPAAEPPKDKKPPPGDGGDGGAGMFIPFAPPVHDPSLRPVASKFQRAPAGMGVGSGHHEYDPPKEPTSEPVAPQWENASPPSQEGSRFVRENQKVGGRDPYESVQEAASAASKHADMAVDAALAAKRLAEQAAAANTYGRKLSEPPNVNVQSYIDSDDDYVDPPPDDGHDSFNDDVNRRQGQYAKPSQFTSRDSHQSSYSQSSDASYDSRYSSDMPVPPSKPRTHQPLPPIMQNQQLHSPPERRYQSEFRYPDRSPSPEMHGRAASYDYHSGGAGGGGGGGYGAGPYPPQKLPGHSSEDGGRRRSNRAEDDEYERYDAPSPQGRGGGGWQDPPSPDNEDDGGRYSGGRGRGGRSGYATAPVSKSERGSGGLGGYGPSQTQPKPVDNSWGRSRAEEDSLEFPPSGAVDVRRDSRTLGNEDSGRYGGGGGSGYGPGYARATPFASEDSIRSSVDGSDRLSRAEEKNEFAPPSVTGLEYQREESYRPPARTGPSPTGYGIGISGSPFDYDKVDDDDVPGGMGISFPDSSKGKRRADDGYKVVSDPPPSGLVQEVLGIPPPPGSTQRADFMKSQGSRPVSVRTRSTFNAGSNYEGSGSLPVEASTVGNPAAASSSTMPGSEDVQAAAEKAWRKAANLPPKEEPAPAPPEDVTHEEVDEFTRRMERLKASHKRGPE